MSALACHMCKHVCIPVGSKRTCELCTFMFTHICRHPCRRAIARVIVCVEYVVCMCVCVAQTVGLIVSLPLCLSISIHRYKLYNLRNSWYATSMTSTTCERVRPLALSLKNTQFFCPGSFFHAPHVNTFGHNCRLACEVPQDGIQIDVPQNCSDNLCLEVMQCEMEQMLNHALPDTFHLAGHGDRKASGIEQLMHLICHLLPDSCWRCSALEINCGNGNAPGGHKSRRTPNTILE
jgi:hypothetical protein